MLVLVFLNSVVELGITATIFAKQQAPINANDLAGMFSQVIHVLAFLVLLYCFTKFIFNFKKFKGMTPKIHMLPNNFPLVVVLIIFLTIPYTMVSISPPLVFAIWLDHNQTSKLISYSLTGTTLVTHMANGIIRIIMIAATLIITAAWLSAENEIESDITDDIGSSMNKYQNTGRFISAIQRIFQSWFVLQWITYFIEIFQRCVAVITYIQTNQEFYIIEAVVGLIYSVLAFAIPYGCGIMMNRYHDGYHRKLREKLRELSFEDHTESLRKKKDILKLIISDPRYHFKPYICGLAIPLNNVGHTLTILLSLLAPVLSLVKFRD